MNIFVLDKNILNNVKSYCDKHVVKMPVEHCQMLMTNFWMITENIENRKQFLNKIEELTIKYNNFPRKNEDGSTSLYGFTMPNHPCTIWARHSSENFDYLIELTQKLLDEFNYRYNKVHSCQYVLDFIKLNRDKMVFKNNNITKFAQAMPDKYRKENSIQAYRDYYCGDKAYMAKWTKREIPNWFQLSL